MKPFPLVSLRLAAIALGAGGFLLGLWIVIATWWTPWSWLGAAVMSLSPPAAAMLWSNVLARGQTRPAMRRYNRRLTGTMAVYFFVLMGATALYQRGAAEGAVGYLIALAPALLIVAIFALFLRFLKEETDEMLRETFLMSLVWSGGLTLCEATVWGFLETFGKAPHVWMWAVPVLFFAQIGITGPLAARKYR